MTIIDNLLTERARVWEQTKTHLDAVEAEGREFSGEAKETYDRHSADLASLDERIAEMGDLAKRNAAADTARAAYGDSAPNVEPEAKKASVTDADRLRSMVNGEARSMEFRDLTVGSATGGGNTVPEGFYSTLMQHMIDNSAIRGTNVTVLTTDSGNDLPVPKTTTHPTAGIISEAGSLTESNAVFGQVTLGAFKYGFSTQISSELEQDTGVDLVGYLAAIGGQALANGSGAHFVSGDGSSKPNGIVTASTLGVTGATSVSGAFTDDNLIDLYFSVIEPYRNNGTWLMADAAMAYARKLKDANDQYIWAPGLTSGDQSTLFGRPVVTDTNVADPAVDAKSVCFGDFSKYVIRDVSGVRIERSVDFAFQNDLITYRFIMRTDGDLVDTTGAVKHFVGAAS
jgi:HK97 family phage major capsid protein